LQAITSASASRVFSAVVRRRTGTGVVEITQDNGSTWTAITLTTSFQRFTTPNQTLTNPTVGFRIVTSGDEIDVDFCQAETGSVATSPIVTTAGTASRVADVVSLTGASSLIGQTEGTLYAEYEVSTLIGAVTRVFLDATDGTTSNRAIAQFTGLASNTVRGGITAGGIVQADQRITGVTGVSRVAFGYKTSDSVIYMNGSAGASTSNGAFTFASPLSKINLGNLEGGTGQLNGWIRSVAIFPTRLANATLQSLTS
jgi:hypothetical protein